MIEISRGMFRTFTKDGTTASIIKEAITAIPPQTKVYVVGGAARNSIYYDIFKKSLPQRDYDLLLVGDLQAYIANLRKNHKFIYGQVRRKDEVSLMKKLVPKPVHITDYLVLDIHRSYEANVQKNLRKNSAFTINGFAIPLKQYLSKEGKRHTITLPSALPDLKKKRLRLNTPGYTGHPGNIFACLRFMSLGFKAPPKNEIDLLLKQLPKLEKRRFKRNVNKVVVYVGGKQNAQRLIKRLGIKLDIFDLKKVRAASILKN